MPTDVPKQAFVERVEKAHGRELRRYLSVRMQNAKADVPDLVQEVYLRMLRIPDYETIRNPLAYLYTVASHVLHQYGLRKAAAPESIELMDVVAQLKNALDADPANELEAEQRFEQLNVGLLAHSPRAYATLVMHRCEGMSLQEIAHELGVSYRMVKRYLAKALAYCDQHFERDK